MAGLASDTINDCYESINERVKRIWDTDIMLMDQSTGNRILLKEENIIFPGTTAQPPEDENPDIWCRIFNLHAGRELIGMGEDALYNNTATYHIQVFVPNGQGIQDLYDISDTFVRELSGFDDGNVMFVEVKPLEVGDDGNYYNVNIQGTYTYQSVV